MTFNVSQKGKRTFLASAFLTVGTCAAMAILTLKYQLMVIENNAPQKTSMIGKLLPSQNYSKWPPFSLPPRVSPCLALSKSAMALESLPDTLKTWKGFKSKPCDEVIDTLIRIYTIEVKETSGTLFIKSSELKRKVKRWLNNVESLYNQVSNQHIVSVFNKYTHDSTVFNSLRAKRPSPVSPFNEKEHLRNQSEATRKTCDFCRYKRFTAEDLIGRIESKYSVTAANVFKFDIWHTMVLLRTHTMNEWSKEALVDMFQTGLKWGEKVQQFTQVPMYLSATMDTIPRAGSSQTHPHMQFTSQYAHYYALQETWRMAAEQYYRNFQSNYFSDLARVHQALGLTVQHGSAVALASLTPKKENEVVVMSRNANQDFFELIYWVFEALFALDLHAMSFSLLIPPLGFQSRPDGDPPAQLRILTRGHVFSEQADFTCLDLFLFSSVNQDPFRLADHMKTFLKGKLLS